MRKGKVYYQDRLAGHISETADGDFIFQYCDNYVVNHPNDFVCFSLPVREKPYHSSRLFAFFDGLIPEGWLLNIATDNWKINPNDRFGLLLACCANCIGAVIVLPDNQQYDE